MPLIAHRINTIAELKELPEQYGVEIDVRFDTRTGKHYLHHDCQGPTAIEKCDFLEDYLAELRFNPKRIVVFNIKDTGTEQKCIELAAKHGIPKSNYFLLDVEFPYIYAATRRGIREIAIRYSEAEPIEQAVVFNGENGPRADWVWIDTNSLLPIDAHVVQHLKLFRTCLVCPERWGRPDDIMPYAKQIRLLGFQLDAVMTNVNYLQAWEESGVVKND